MGNVYAWKLYRGDEVAGYCFLPGPDGYEVNDAPFVEDCAEIPPSAAVNARNLKSEEAYKNAFELMVSLLPEEFASCLKHYSAYYDIGCDKPKDYNTCEETE